MSLTLNDTFRCHIQTRTIQLIFLPLQALDSNTQFRALAVVRERSCGKPRWSSHYPHSAPKRVKLLAPSSFTESTVFILLRGCTHKAAKDNSDQQSYWMPAIHGELLTVTASPRIKASTTSRPSSLTGLLSSPLHMLVYKRRGTGMTDNPV